MCLAFGVTLFALWGTVFSATFRVDVNMAGIKGYLEFNSLQQTAVQNLTGTCEGVINISLHEFPVMYGHSPEPCDQANIGEQLYTFSFNKSQSPSEAFNVNGLFGANAVLDDLSLVIKTCNRQACGNVRKPGATIRTWQAKFYTSVIGEAYFRQQDGETSSLTILTDFVTVREGESTVLNVPMYFSPTCDLSESKANVSLGVFKVGSLPKAIKSGRRVANITVQQFASLRYKDQWVCAQLQQLETKSVNAIINMNGVRGLLNFTQVSPFDPTQISVNLRNASGLEKYYHVHKFPVPHRRDPSENLCDQNSTGDHWNPFNANVSAATYPKVSGESHNLYEIGDLSGKHGPLEGMNRSSSTFLDWNLPLFGRNSIVGRSIVIHKADNTRLACGSIGYGGEVIMGVAVFRTTVVGRVIFRQLKSNPYADLSIYIDLSYSNVSALTTTNHNWHIHEFPISTETDADGEACRSTKGHFNPTGIEVNGNYSLQCQPQSPFLCEVGDFAGKHKPLNLTSYARSVQAKAFFTDTTSALSGSASFLGKSIVIHGAGQTLTRIACANITSLRPSVGKTGQWFGSKQVEGEFNVSQHVELDPTAISISFTNLKSVCGGYHVHLLPITQSSPEPCADILIKGHFNPFLINMTLSPSPGMGTVDKYEVGDISGKYGTLADKNTHFQQYLDSNLPLSGPHSILGRSLVIHYINGSRLQCANIEPQKAEDGEWVHAKVDFNGTVKGSILMLQQVFPDGSYSDTTIEVNLQSSSAQGMEIQWCISSHFLYEPHHQYPSNDMDEAYNPYWTYKGTDSRSSCSQGYPLHCAVGDMTGKHGPITVTKRQLMTDGNLPLTGDFTVFGRGMLLKSGQEVVDCSTITFDGPVITLVFPIVTNFSRYEFRSTIAQVLSVPLWKVNILSGETTEVVLEKCQKMSIFVIGYSDTQKLESIKHQEGLHKFKSSPLCVPASAPTGAASMVVSQQLPVLWLMLLWFIHRLQLAELFGC